jgi:hypothetical protein
MNFNQFRSEVSLLESLYFASRYSADVAARELRNGKADGSLDLAEPIHTVDTIEEYDAPNGYAVHKYLRRHYLKSLREVILVRLVSTLEVFLVDTVEHLFFSRKDLFSRNEKIELHYGEVISADSITEIWSKLIQRECRRLQNQGFGEVRKFYLQRFGVDFAVSRASIAKLEEMHDRRHILVHRLGKSDAYYRHKYNSSEVRLPVSETYLLEAFRAALGFANYIDRECGRLAKESRSSTYDPRAYRVRLDLVDIDDSALGLVDEGFQIFIDEDAVKLGDLLESKLQTRNEVSIVLSGEISFVRAYLKVVKRAQRARTLVLQERTVLSQGHHCSLDDEEVKNVARRLPSRPWPKHVHKSIAEELGFSNKQVSSAISLILDAPERFGAEDKV